MTEIVRDNPWIRLACRSLGLAGALVLMTCVLAPGLGLVGRLLMDGRAPTDGWGFSDRQWRLLLESLLLSTGGAALAMLLAWPVAAVLTREARLSMRLGVAGTLLISPMAASFGWQHLLKCTTPPVWLGRLGCMMVWGAWAWPIAALPLAWSWRGAARGPYEDALMSCSPARAFVAVGVAAIRPAIVTSTLCLLVVLSCEYLVPHAWGLKVYATELLTWATTTDRPIDAVYTAVPLCGVLMAGIALLALSAPRRWSDAHPDHDESVRRAALRTRRLGAVVVCLSWLPLLGLAWRLGSVRMLEEVMTVHRDDLVGSLAVCAGAGLASMLMGAGLWTFSDRLRRWGWCTLAWGVVPGAVVGSAVASTFGGASLTSDHWVKFVAGLTARFGWVAWLTTWFALRGARSIEEQASMDGADRMRILWAMRLVRAWPALAVSGLVVCTLGLSDLATTVQVQVSSFVPIALVLVDKMHKFEDGYVLAISLILECACLPAVAAAALVRRRV